MTFQLTTSHIALLQNVWVRWLEIEFGAPCIDPKRPFGNSDVMADMLSILGWEDTPENRRRAQDLYRELDRAAAIVFRHGPIPGLYRTSSPYRQDWMPA